MGLAATERLHGRVQDSIGRDSVTVSSGALPAGAFSSGGFLRDADGRMLVAVETLDAAASAGSYVSGGFLRDSSGRLVVAQASGALSGGQRVSGGEVRDSAGRLVMTSEVLDAAVSAGDYSSNGQRDAYGRRIAAGLVTTFDPASISGLVGWWKADALALADGAAVASWADSSGAANHATQGTGTKQPIYKTGILNGKPVVRFDGSNDQLTTALTLAQPATIFVVGIAGGSGAYGPFVGGKQSVYKWNGPNYLSLNAGVALTSTTPVLGTHQISALFNGASSQGWVDGAPVVSGNAGNTAPGALNLGSDATAGTFFYSGDMAEVLAYSGALTTTDRQAVEAYLKGKWATP